MSDASFRGVEGSDDDDSEIYTSGDEEESGSDTADAAGTTQSGHSLTNAGKYALVARYMHSINRKTKRLYSGELEGICEAFSVRKRTVQRTVKEYNAQINNGIKVPNWTNQKARDKRKKKAKRTSTMSDNIEKLRRTCKEEHGKDLTLRDMVESYEQEYGKKFAISTLWRYDRNVKENGTRSNDGIKVLDQKTRDKLNTKAKHTATVRKNIKKLRRKYKEEHGKDLTLSDMVESYEQEYGRRFAISTLCRYKNSSSTASLKEENQGIKYSRKVHPQQEQVEL